MGGINTRNCPEIEDGVDYSVPVIGITMGDAAGIGPEVILKALCDNEVLECARPLVIGDLDHLEKLANSLGLSISFNEVSENTEHRNGHGVEVCDLKNLQQEGDP